MRSEAFPANFILDMEMGEQEAVAVEALPAVAKADGAPPHHGLERPLRLPGERPSYEPGAAEGQLRRLDTNQAHLGGAGDDVLQSHRIAVPHFAHHGSAASSRPPAAKAGVAGERTARKSAAMAWRRAVMVCGA